MADKTQQLDITTAWTEISAARVGTRWPSGLADGSDYLIDILTADSQATAYTASTDDITTPPHDDIIGQPIYPANKNRGTDTRIYQKRAGGFPWVRIDRGTATVEATLIEE